MTYLECRALNCINNHSRLCCLEGIEVCGPGANHVNETCCASFMDEADSYGNTVDNRDAMPETEIECDAEKCVHNSEGYCAAEDVLIDGSYAHRKEATDCNTFIERG